MLLAFITTLKVNPNKHAVIDETKNRNNAVRHQQHTQTHACKINRISQEIRYAFLVVDNNRDSIIYRHEHKPHYHSRLCT